MLVYRSRIDRLDVLARAIFSSLAVFKREALVAALWLVLIAPTHEGMARLS